MQDWESDLALFESGVKVIPENVKIRNNYAMELKSAGRLDEASLQYQVLLSSWHTKLHNFFSSNPWSWTLTMGKSTSTMATYYMILEICPKLQSSENNILYTLFKSNIFPTPLSLPPSFLCGPALSEQYSFHICMQRP